AVGVSFADVVAPEINGRGTSASRIFPLRLREQAIGPACHPGEPRHIPLSVVPGDICHRPRAPAIAAVAHLRALTNGDAGVPLVEVASCLDTAKARSIVTLCCGPSLAARPFSASGEPMTNSPGGMTITSGQSLAHSLKRS